MKKYKIITIITLIAIMAVSSTVFATPSTPYSHYDAWFQSDDQGCAGIYRCSCNPVNNYLSASAKVQYNDNGNYLWTNWQTSANANVQQRAFIVNSPNNCYVNRVEQAS